MAVFLLSEVIQQLLLLQHLSVSQLMKYNRKAEENIKPPA
jgi:hypothetical protein